jgi:hypothetical protein
MLLSSPVLILLPSPSFPTVAQALGRPRALHARLVSVGGVLHRGHAGALRRGHDALGARLVPAPDEGAPRLLALLRLVSFS